MVVQKKIKKDGAHQFAFYISNLANCFQNEKVIHIDDADIVHRIVRVLRLSVGEELIVFDERQHVYAKVEQIGKHYVVLSVFKKTKNNIFLPKITYLLPLLKKESLQEAVYSLTEVGVNKIQLMVTAKSRQSITNKEFERLQKTIIAAAEQSKHYAIPELNNSQLLLDSVEQLSDKDSKIMFDINGISFFDLKHSIKDSNICLLVGPEGGLTSDELNDLQKYNFKSCALTPTILRAVQAVPLSAALFRIM